MKQSYSRALTSQELKNCAKNPLMAPMSEDKNQQWFQPPNML